MCVSSIPKSPPTTQSPSSQASGISSISLGGSCCGLVPPSAHRLFNIWGVWCLLCSGSRAPFLVKETAKLWNQCHFPDGTHFTHRGQPLSKMITDDGKKFPGWKGHWGEPEVLLMAPYSMASDNLGDGLIRQPLFPCDFLKMYLCGH